MDYTQRGRFGYRDVWNTTGLVPRIQIFKEDRQHISTLLSRSTNRLYTKSKLGEVKGIVRNVKDRRNNKEYR